MATYLLIRATWRAAVPRSRRLPKSSSYFAAPDRADALQGFGRQWLETKKNHRTEATVVTVSVSISDQGLASGFGLSQLGRGRVCTPSMAAAVIKVQSPSFFKLVTSPNIVSRVHLLRDDRALLASPSPFHGSPDKAILEEPAASAPVRGADGADALQGFGRQWLETKKNHRTEATVVTVSVLISDQGLASGFGLPQPGRGRVCTPSMAAAGIKVQSASFFNLVTSPNIVGRVQLLRDHRALRASPSPFHGSPAKAILNATT
jgi:hypothetical protein